MPSGGRDRNSGWLVALGMVAIVAVLAAVLLTDRGPEPAPDTTSSVPAPAEGDDPAPEAEPATTGSTVAPGTTPTTSAGPRPDGVPANWVAYSDRTVGYTIWHPPSWRPQPQGDSRTDLVDPDTGDYLRVDYTTAPGDDPEEAWHDASDSFAERYDDYQELRIEEREYQGFPAAVWEYTYQGKHATNLGFVTDDYGFALNFQTDEERWDDRQDIRRAFEAGFRAP